MIKAWVRGVLSLNALGGDRTLGRPHPVPQELQKAEVIGEIVGLPGSEVGEAGPPDPTALAGLERKPVARQPAL